MSGYQQNLSGGEAGPEGRERGARRKKLAGYLKAANELRQSYQTSYTEKWNADKEEMDEDMKGIPGSFPDVAIVEHGDEQLVLFPSYARRHTKTKPDPEDLSQRDKDGSNSDGPGDAEFWAKQWQKYEDDHAIVDVDVRGWIYSPHRGPMSRKNRVLVGLARQLSGIPAPKTSSRDNSPDAAPSLNSKHKEHERQREEQRIAQEAEEILRKGEGEQKKAAQGKYSEEPRLGADLQNVYGQRGRPGSRPLSQVDQDPPGPGHLTKRTSWNQPADMTPAELVTANQHLMARIMPFMTNPLVSTPVTVFFYDEKTSISRTVTTNDAGHFIMRAALDFVPTHVRVLASENLSAVEEVKITEPQGVSLITDVDDTIKHSSIGSGAREIFRNAFIRDLGDLTIDGVKEWYNTMYDMGVGFHYVSNSPWQLFPVLVSFFSKAGLPPGSYHLKQYSGMLQGIFEPVAERKKGTLERILRDFPERKFILVGDSGEADLEVYTDVVLANPKRVLAIFIRDVTTPEGQGFFDSAMGPLAGLQGQNRESSSTRESRESRTQRKPTDSVEDRPPLPQRPVSEVIPQTSDGPTMGKLIDFGDDEPEAPEVHKSHRQVMARSVSSVDGLESPRRKSAPENGGRAPPPRPTKPAALRGNTSIQALTELSDGTANKNTPPAPPKARRSNPSTTSTPPHPLAESQSIADLNDNDGSYMSAARSKISAAYNSLPEVRSHLPGRTASTYSDTSSINSDNPNATPPPPPPRRGAAAAAAATGYATSKLSSAARHRTANSTDTSDDESIYNNSTGGNVPVNKKLDLWRRRFKRSKDILDSQGVVLRTWRVGEDVCLDAVQLVEKTMREMGVEGYGEKGRGKGKTGEGGGEVKVKDLKR